MFDAQIFKYAAGVSSIFSLCAFLGALYIWFSSRRRERSLVQDIQGEGIVHAESVVKILKQFKSDEHRLRALQEVLGYDRSRAEGVLQRVKPDIEVGRFSLMQEIELRKKLLIVGLVLLGFAVTVAVAAKKSSQEKEEGPSRDKTVWALGNWEAFHAATVGNPPSSRRSITYELDVVQNFGQLSAIFRYSQTEDATAPTNTVKACEALYSIKFSNVQKPDSLDFEGNLYQKTCDNWLVAPNFSTIKGTLIRVSADRLELDADIFRGSQVLTKRRIP